MAVRNYKYFHITGTDDDGLVLTGAGTLYAIVINKSGAATVTLYDSLTTDNTIGIITIDTAANNQSPTTLLYNVHLKVGLNVIVSAACDLTVVYRKD